jgi:hypothetical protein
MKDEEFSLVVGALVGNTTMDVLDVSENLISSNSIGDILRLATLTRLKTIDVRFRNGYVFSDRQLAVHCFASVLHRNSSSLEELPGLDLDRFPLIRSVLFRNRSVRRARELLSVQTGTGVPIATKRERYLVHGNGEIRSAAIGSTSDK